MASAKKELSLAIKKEPSSTESVYFVCQQCCQPISLHKSFHTITSEELGQLAAPLVAPLTESASSSDHNVRLSLNAAAPSDGVIRRSVSRMKGATATYQDFALLTSPDSLEMNNLSYRLKVSSQLFDIMSGNGNVDHPLCQDCTSSLMDSMVKQLGESEKELKTYQDYLGQLKASPLPDMVELQGELDQLTQEEQELLAQLESVEVERAQVAEQTKSLHEEQAQLAAEEEKYYKELSAHKYRERALVDEQQSVDNQLQHAQAQLNTLERTNVYNFTFRIWHNGHFATINGFRLGRLPTVPVEWSEINAALGQAALLLHSLARRLNIRFEGYRLMPYGNMSYLETTQEKKKTLPLFSNGGLRVFWDSKFDNALVAFLNLVSQFKMQVETASQQDDSPAMPFKFPFRIEEDKIGDVDGSMYSVRNQFNTEENWTKALKFVLILLKWGLAYLTTKLSPHNAPTRPTA